jgi:hydrogenase nickel incorporation protein HypA/HybF
MHELSIASAILERVQAEAGRQTGHISRVGVRVGELSGVSPDALAFGFEMLVKDTDMEPLALAIEVCPRRQRCSACENEFAVPAPGLETACPKCGSPATVCIAGDELDIAFMEVEDE